MIPSAEPELIPGKPISVSVYDYQPTRPGKLLLVESAFISINGKNVIYGFRHGEPGKRCYAEGAGAYRYTNSDSLESIRRLAHEVEDIGLYGGIRLTPYSSRAIGTVTYDNLVHGYYRAGEIDMEDDEWPTIRELAGSRDTLDLWQRLIGDHLVEEWP